MHPIKKITILLVMYMLSGCATISKNYNTPFINTDETITLEYGMKKSTVRNTLGYPLYVDMGNENSGKIVWVYEVRTIEVESDMLMGGKISVAKISDDTRHAAPIHRIELTFVDNELISWGPPGPPASDEDEYADEEEEELEEDVAENDEETEVKKQKKIKLFFMPTASFLLQSYGHDNKRGARLSDASNSELDIEINESGSRSFTGPSGGFYAGFETLSKFRFGAEGRLGFKNLAIMGVIEIPIPIENELSLLVGGGVDYAFDNDDSSENARISIMKVGLAKSINERISAKVEFFPFIVDEWYEGGDYDSNNGVSSLGILLSARLHL